MITKPVLYGNLITWFLHLLSLLQGCLALHINALPRANVKCNEVLTKNLECPSIGSFSVAGVCDYFVRCIQTEKGVEPEVDFCPDGTIYVVNRCVKSNNIHDCPQNMCALAKPVEKTTPKSIFPTTSTTPNVKPTTGTTHKIKPIKTTKIPFLNLHPSLNEASERHLKTSFTFLFPILLPMIINTL